MSLGGSTCSNTSTFEEEEEGGGRRREGGGGRRKEEEMNGEGQEEERSGEGWRRGKKEKRQLNKVGIRKVCTCMEKYVDDPSGPVLSQDHYMFSRYVEGLYEAIHL